MWAWHRGEAFVNGRLDMEHRWGVCIGKQRLTVRFHGLEALFFSFFLKKFSRSCVLIALFVPSPNNLLLIDARMAMAN